MVDAAPPDEEHGVYKSILGKNAGSVPRSRKYFRYVLCVVALLACAVLAFDNVIDSVIFGSDRQNELHRADIGQAVELVDVQSAPYLNDPSCPADGSVCVCTGSYTVAGKDPYGYNILQPSPGHTACQVWKFEIGDFILVEEPLHAAFKFPEAHIVAQFTGSPVVHNAVVTELPPPGVQQTGDNVFVTEAMKGSWKRVLRNSFRTLIERYPFGGVSIRRVDEAKYPNFFNLQTQVQITNFANSIVGQPFDRAMVNPAKRRLFTNGRFINPAWGPTCHERHRAHQMFLAGGPGQWVCPQLVAWILAFPGGLNMDPAKVKPECDLPEWVIKNLQPNPGDMLNADFVAPGAWRAPCDAQGCWLGVPANAEWAGGTTAAPTPAPIPAPTPALAVKPTLAPHLKPLAKPKPEPSPKRADESTPAPAPKGDEQPTPAPTPKQDEQPTLAPASKGDAESTATRAPKHAAKETPAPTSVAKPTPVADPKATTSVVDA